MPKRCKGCHFAQATERHRAQTTQSRQKPPAPHPPAPQAPDPPFRSRGIAKAGPGGRGWIIGLDQPPPSLSRLRRSHRTRTTSSIPNQQAHHAAPWGRRTSPACGSCRRPRKERQRKRGAMSRRTTNIHEKITRTREKQKERENKTQRRSTAGNETKGSTADVAESMLSRSEDYVSPAREAESIVRRPKMYHFPS